MTSVTVSNISSFRNTDVESWITSDGRVYLVQLVEGDESDTVTSHWEGTQADPEVCFFRRHGFRDGINARLFY
jgi:hypothetical protein